MNIIESKLLKYNDQLLAFVRNKVSDPNLAIDVLQESFFKALRSIGNLKDESKLLPWFYRILQGTIIDLYRRRSIEKKAIEKISQELDSKIEPDDETTLCDCLKELIPTLKPEYAELINLELNKMSSDEVMNKLGITRNNLKVRRFRAREQLKIRLEESCNICATHGCLNCDCKNQEKHL